MMCLRQRAEDRNNKGVCGGHVCICAHGSVWGCEGWDGNWVMVQTVCEAPRASY